jgi:hypothetical protein
VVAEERGDELREFMEILYRALMMVARWIERRYLRPSRKT